MYRKGSSCAAMAATSRKATLHEQWAEKPHKIVGRKATQLNQKTNKSKEERLFLVNMYCSYVDLSLLYFLSLKLITYDAFYVRCTCIALNHTCFNIDCMSICQHEPKMRRANNLI